MRSIIFAVFTIFTTSALAAEINLWDDRERESVRYQDADFANATAEIRMHAVFVKGSESPDYQQLRFELTCYCGPNSETLYYVAQVPLGSQAPHTADVFQTNDKWQIDGEAMSELIIEVGDRQILKGEIFGEILNAAARF